MKNKLKKHLNLNVQGLSISATLYINERSNQLITEGRQVYKLGLGQSPFPVPSVVESELKINAYQKDYLPVLGLYELRKAVAEYISHTQGVPIGADNVMIGPGSKELMFIVQLVYYGNLLIPTPSWVSYAPQAHIIGRQIQWLSTDVTSLWKVQPSEIKNLCVKDPDRPRLLILNYPANPHSYTYSPDELKAIAKVCREYGIVVLSDEIYGELSFNKPHVSMIRFYPEGTIISSGISKWAGAGGWRLGCFVFPNQLNWLQEAMATVASETYTSTSAPIQYAAVRAFRGGLEIENYLVHSRRILKALSRYFTRTLELVDIHVEDTDGGFYLFPDFGNYREAFHKHGISNSLDLCERLLEDIGVACLPGVVFGRPKEEFTARLALVDFDGARVLLASEQIPFDQEIDEEFLKMYCGNCKKAIELVASWLKTL